MEYGLIMARAARVVVPGAPHHVIQRGNNRQDVFFTDDDRRNYLHTLRTQCDRYFVRLRAWCLMTNHIHLVAVPKDREALSKAVGRAHWLYTQYINRLYDRVGHLWQNRFYSCVLDAEHELAAVRYIERNPVRARIVRQAWRYKWSSAAVHCGEASQLSLVDVDLWRRRFSPVQWRKILQDPGDECVVEQIRTRTRTGRPLGSDRFIRRIETKLHRSLTAPKLGRPVSGQSPG